MADATSAPAPAPISGGSTAVRGTTAVTTASIGLGYVFQCIEAHSIVTPNQAQEGVLALALVVAWDWWREILQRSAARKAGLLIPTVTVADQIRAQLLPITASLDAIRAALTPTKPVADPGPSPQQEHPTHE